MVVSNIFDFHPGSLQNDKRWSLKGPQGWPYYIGNWCYFTPKTMESYRAPTALTGRSPLWCTWLISTGVSYELYRVYIYNIYIRIYIYILFCIETAFSTFYLFIFLGQFGLLGRLKSRSDPNLPTNTFFRTGWEARGQERPWRWETQIRGALPSAPFLPSDSFP